MPTESSNKARKSGHADDVADRLPQDPVVLDLIEALDSVPDPCCVLSGKNLSILDLGVLMSGPPIFNKTTLMSLLVSPEELKMWLWERGMTVGGYVSVDLRKSLVAP